MEPVIETAQSQDIADGEVGSADHPSNRPSVLHLIDPQSPGGGPCSLRLLGQLISRLDSIEHDVLVLGTRSEVELALRCGVRASGWVCPVRMLPFAGHRDVKRFVRSVRGVHGRFDVVHAWTPRCSILATLIAPRSPRVATLNVGPEPAFANKYLSRLLARDPMAVLAATNSTGRDCRRSGLSRSLVALFPPAVSIEGEHLPSRTEVRNNWGIDRRIDDETFVVGLLCEPANWAHARAAATAVARLVLSGRNIKLVMHSAPNQRVSAVRLLESLNLQDSLITDDAIAEPWLVAIGLDAALALNTRPTSTSASVLPMLWSMAAGVPVIAQAGDGVRQIIEEGVNGWVVNSTDLKAITDRLVKLDDDRSLAKRIGAAGRELVTDTYDIASYAERIRHTYDLLLANRRGQSNAPSRPAKMAWPAAEYR